MHASVYTSCNYRVTCIAIAHLCSKLVFHLQQACPNNFVYLHDSTCSKLFGSKPRYSFSQLAASLQQFDVYYFMACRRINYGMLGKLAMGLCTVHEQPSQFPSWNKPATHLLNNQRVVRGFTLVLAAFFLHFWATAMHCACGLNFRWKKHETPVSRPNATQRYGMTQPVLVQLPP